MRSCFMWVDLFYVYMRLGMFRWNSQKHLCCCAQTTKFDRVNRWSTSGIPSQMVSSEYRRALLSVLQEVKLLPHTGIGWSFLQQSFHVRLRQLYCRRFFRLTVLRPSEASAGSRIQLFSPFHPTWQECKMSERYRVHWWLLMVFCNAFKSFLVVLWLLF